MTLPAVGFYAEGYNQTAWRVAFAEQGVDLQPWPHWDRHLKVALLWQPPASLFTDNPNLELIISLGAGVDHLLKLGKSLPTLPIVRMADPGLVEFMHNFVVMSALYHHRDMGQYSISQQRSEWAPRECTYAKDRTIGFVGLGNMTQGPAKTLHDLGHPVLSWTRTKKELPFVESFFGPTQFKEFLQRTDILVSSLPATHETTHLLNKSTLSLLPVGACVINVGRGNVLDLDGLLELIQNGHIRGATLDVFDEEPLPADSPVWSQREVQVTPHIASPSLPPSIAQYVARVVQDYKAGKPLPNLLDRTLGY